MFTNKWQLAEFRLCLDKAEQHIVVLFVNTERLFSNKRLFLEWKQQQGVVDIVNFHFSKISYNNNHLL